MTKQTKTIFIITSLVIVVVTSIVFTIAYENSKANNNSSTNQSMVKPSGMTMHGDLKNESHGHGKMNMSEMVKDDKSFIENMIPHHQEAVDTSKIILSKSENDDLKSFAQKVITDQEREVELMKKWHKQWYVVDFTDNSNYSPMMGDLDKLNGDELDKAYIKGMIEHHMGAIMMAKSIQPLTQKEEIKDLASDIINSQENEINTLNNWLMSRFDDHSMMLRY